MLKLCVTPGPGFALLMIERRIQYCVCVCIIRFKIFYEYVKKDTAYLGIQYLHTGLESISQDDVF